MTEGPRWVSAGTRSAPSPEWWRPCPSSGSGCAASCGARPDLLVAAYERALALAARGRRREALAALADLAAARERVLGADHPDTRATARAIRDLRDGRDPDPPRHLI